MAEDTTADVWILAIVTAMGWQGTDVVFQEFSSEERCRHAAAVVGRKIEKHGGGKSWAMEVFPK